MSRRVRFTLGVSITLSFIGCAGPGVGAGRKGDEPKELDVVANETAFDPTQAVDDADEALARGDAPQDERTFEDREAGANVVADRPIEPAAGAAPGPAESLEEDDASGEPVQEFAGEVTPPESVAKPDEVEELRAAREQRLIRGAEGGDEAEDQAKLSIARNPHLEPMEASEGVVWGVLDFVLEGLVLVVLALLAAALWTGLAGLRGIARGAANRSA